MKARGIPVCLGKLSFQQFKLYVPISYYTSNSPEIPSHNHGRRKKQTLSSEISLHGEPGSIKI